jgi:hypothetical protein
MLNLAGETAKTGLDEPVNLEIPGSNYLSPQKILVRLFAQQRHPLVVRNEDDPEVESEQCMINDRENDCARCTQKIKQERSPKQIVYRQANYFRRRTLRPSSDQETKPISL